MSVRQRAGFLSLNRISELVWNSERYETLAPSDNSSEDGGGFQDEPGLSHPQPDWSTCRGHAFSSSLSSNASEEKEIFQSGQVQTPSTSHWTRHSGPDKSVVYAFRGGPRGQRDNEGPHIKWSFQSKLFLFYLAEIITLLLLDAITASLTELNTDLRQTLTRLRPKCLCFLL